MRTNAVSRETEDTRLAQLGSDLVRLVVDGNNTFFDSNDEKRKNPLNVAPIQQGLTTIQIELKPPFEYKPSLREKMNYELGCKIKKFRSLGLINDQRVGVRISSFADYVPPQEVYAVDFYVIRDEKQE